MTVLVDHREKSSIPSLLTKLQVPTTIVELEFGDYDAGILIEHKTAEDYVNSVIDGRLNLQLYELSTNFKRSVLLVDGPVEAELFKRKMPNNIYYSSVAGSIFKTSSAGEQGSISFFNASSEYDSALLIKYLHEKYLRGEPRTPKKLKHKFSGDDDLVYTLSSIPSIGEMRAKLLLDRFQSISGLVSAEIEELSKVPKISQILAESLYNFFRKKYGETKSD